jgi:uncharacterized tellurite resistance protein B-like protein
MLLPQIATYFDVSIDELLGYKPQLSPEQIRNKYQFLAKEFVEQPFEKVFKKSKALVKEYYSCYPFLLQIGVLWLNHFMFAKEQKRQMEILECIEELCEHICNECTIVGVCSDASILKAMVNLQMGKAKEVIDILEPLNDPKRLSAQTDSILIHAYQVNGDVSKAESYSQITIYTHLLSLVGNSLSYLALHLQDKNVGEQTISRVSQIIATYDLERLSSNTTLQFQFHVVLFYCVHGEKEQALKELKAFVNGSLALFNDGCYLHGDDYFNRLDEWFHDLDLGVMPPRNPLAIIDSVKQAIEHPTLSILFDTKEYQVIKQQLYSRGE